MTTAAQAGQRLSATVLNAIANAGTSSVQDEVASAGSTTSTSFTATLTSSTAPGVVFVAPPSGRVIVGWHSNLVNTTSGQEARVGWELRVGGTIGSGSVVVAATDVRSLRIKGASTTNDVAFGSTYLVTALTPGSTYNVRQMYRVSSGTGLFEAKIINVVPAH